MHVLLALALRNTQAVRDAAAAKLGVLRVSVRKGCCAPWTPARRSGCSWPILWRFSARETSWAWAWQLRCWRRWRSSGASPSHVCCAKEPSPILIVGFLLVYNVAASGWLAGIAVALRLLLLVWASLLLMALSTPAELSEGLRRLFSPLGRLGLPVRDFATSLSIALRFMPLLSEELRAVRAAQASRGAAFEDAGLVRRLRAYGGLMVPVLVGLFRRADRLAAAMEARCYGASGEPTSLVERRFSAGDGAVLLVGVAACVAFALVP